METYRERLPAAALADLVSCVWVQRVPADAPASTQRTVPNGSIEVVCIVGSEQAWLAGPRLEPRLARLDPGTTIVGARLRPGAPAATIGASAQELVGRDVALAAVWGRPAAERIAECATPEALERELAPRRAAPDPVVVGTVQALQPWRRGGLDAVARDLYISPRQLRRRCLAAFGFGPKTLQRLLRFQGFLALADRHEDGVGRLAAAAGYYDQAHLTRECRALAGLTPAAFLDELRATCGANHDHAASFAGLRRALG